MLAAAYSDPDAQPLDPEALAKMHRISPVKALRQRLGMAQVQEGRCQRIQGQAPGAVTRLRVISSLVAVDYEWDATKAAENRRRHGIDFPDSIAAIEDPNRHEEIDTRFEYGEERIRVIGMAAGNPIRRHDSARRQDVPHHLRPEGHTT